MEEIQIGIKERVPYYRKFNHTHFDSNKRGRALYIASFTSDFNQIWFENEAGEMIDFETNKVITFEK